MFMVQLVIPRFMNTDQNSLSAQEKKLFFDLVIKELNLAMFSVMYYLQTKCQRTVPLNNLRHLNENLYIYCIKYIYQKKHLMYA